MQDDSQTCQVCECREESCKNCIKKTQCGDCSSNSENACCCTFNHATWHGNQIRKGLFLERLSLGWMGVEVIGSIIAGLVIGKSFALLAFAGDSMIELISAYAVLSYLTNLSKGRFLQSESERTERISLTLLVLLIPAITLVAIYSYISGIKPEASLLGIAVSLAAVGIMSYLWIEKRKLGTNANIIPLKIDATESATCLFMSTAVLGGLLVEYFLGISWADYVASAIILGFVILEIRGLFQELKHP